MDWTCSKVLESGGYVALFTLKRAPWCCQTKFLTRQQNDPIDVSRTSRIARGGRSLANETLFESAEEVEFRRRSQAPPPTTYSRPPPPAQPSDSRQHLDSLRVAGQRWAHWGNPGLDWGPPLPFGSSSRDAPRQSEAERERVRDRAPGRDRDETNALIGQTLRTKKDCLLVYCGARKEEPLPKGFTFKNEGSEKVSSVGGGCGALVCARGLGGVPKRLFEQTEGEEETVSSDLPPLAERVGDVEKGKEQKSMRGLNGCEGCRTKDIGCRAWCVSSVNPPLYLLLTFSDQWQHPGVQSCATLSSLQQSAHTHHGRVLLALSFRQCHDASSPERCSSSLQHFFIPTSFSLPIASTNISPRFTLKHHRSSRARPNS